MRTLLTIHLKLLGIACDRNTPVQKFGAGIARSALDQLHDAQVSNFLVNYTLTTSLPPSNRLILGFALSQRFLFWN
ncbi:MAG: hypothetical protein JO334_06675 [Verrucomicrobia bacterium]|nr:hypothetical protein [Verrucomicrobiota bacterium]